MGLIAASFSSPASCLIGNDSVDGGGLPHRERGDGQRRGCLLSLQEPQVRGRELLHRGRRRRRRELTDPEPSADAPTAVIPLALADLLAEGP